MKADIGLLLEVPGDAFLFLSFILLDTMAASVVLPVLVNLITVTLGCQE